MGMLSASIRMTSTVWFGGGGSAGSCSEIVMPRRLSWRRTIEMSRSSLITMRARRPRTEKGEGLVISRYADGLNASSAHHGPVQAYCQPLRGHGTQDRDMTAMLRSTIHIY